MDEKSNIGRYVDVRKGRRFCRKAERGKERKTEGEVGSVGGRVFGKRGRLDIQVTSSLDD